MALKQSMNQIWYLISVTEVDNIHCRFYCFIL